MCFNSKLIFVTFICESVLFGLTVLYNVAVRLSGVLLMILVVLLTYSAVALLLISVNHNPPCVGSHVTALESTLKSSPLRRKDIIFDIIVFAISLGMGNI